MVVGLIASTLGGAAAYGMATQEEAETQTSSHGSRSIDANQIYQQVTTGPGTHSIENAQRASDRLQQRHQERLRRMEELDRVMESAWTGEAGGAARRGMEPMRVWLEDAQTNLGTIGRVFSDQQAAFGTVHSKVEPMPAKPPESGFLNDINPFTTDTDREIAEYNRKAHANVDAFNEYYRSSAENSGRLPAYHSAPAGNNATPDIETTSATAGGTASPGASDPGAGGFGMTPGAAGPGAAGPWANGTGAPGAGADGPTPGGHGYTSADGLGSHAAPAAGPHSVVGDSTAPVGDAGGGVSSSGVPSASVPGGHAGGTAPGVVPGSGPAQGTAAHHTYAPHDPGFAAPNDDTAQAGYTAPTVNSGTTGFGSGMAGAPSAGFGPGSSASGMATSDNGLHGSAAPYGGGAYGSSGAGSGGFGPRGSSAVNGGATSSAVSPGSSTTGSNYSGISRGSTGGSGMGARAPMMGPMGAGRGQGGDEEEHDRKYLIEEDANELFGTDQKTPPPVIGE